MLPPRYAERVAGVTRARSRLFGAVLGAIVLGILVLMVLKPGA